MSRQPNPAARVWARVVLDFSQDMAHRVFNRAADYQAETKDPDFLEHARKYSSVLWRWIMEDVPDSVLNSLNGIYRGDPKLDEAITCKNYQYLLRRVSFIDGLRYGDKAHDPTWNVNFLPFQNAAAALGDVAVAKAITTATRKRESDTGKPSLLRYGILIGWLGLGLWKLRNDKERHDRLNQHFRESLGKTSTGLEKWKCIAKSDQAFAKACERLGLR